ncbi:MAG TPA: SDR family oxidoreductase [Mycobacteriales bacterium]|jgi:NAD(P)-dependent dehydrogenase (short-subunit alcohol dehydrogenase family)|nr:SDR family oxidoreductase [Mycobacteriales bacterium]
MKLKDKVVVVTGSGRGIGEAFARRFTAEGAKVVVTDIDADAVARVAGEIGSVGLAADITVEDNVRAVAELARSNYGEIDVWFSNAGVAGPRQLGEIPDNALWDLGWDLHVMAHVYAAREVLPAMLERGDGYLIQTASIVGLTIQPEKAAYSVSKHAAVALAEWLAVTYGDRGIRVSCFCPGAMLTPMFLANGLAPDHPAVKMALTPEQVAEVLVHGIDAERFLILDRSGSTEEVLAKGNDYDEWIRAARGRARAFDPKS